PGFDSQEEQAAVAREIERRRRGGRFPVSGVAGRELAGARDFRFDGHPVYRASGFAPDFAAGRLGRTSLEERLPCRGLPGYSGDRDALYKEPAMSTAPVSTTMVDTAIGEAKTMVLNMGPQHPSTHGVLRILLELDGETVVKAIPDLGYLHTGIEKSCEDKTYSQAITLTDRMDYLNPLGNNLAYCMAVEKLLGLEVPKRAQYIRVMMVELQRISSHLVWLGTHAIDLGAMSVFLY